MKRTRASTGNQAHSEAHAEKPIVVQIQTKQGTFLRTPVSTWVDSDADGRDGDAHGRAVGDDPSITTPEGRDLEAGAVTASLTCAPGPVSIW